VALSVVALASLVHCQAYDEAPLKGSKALAPAEPRASTTASASTEIPEDQPDGPAVAQVSPPKGVEEPVTRCGDGIISGVEKCDTAIEDPASGACPTACPALAACAQRVLNGTACQAECVLIEPSCKNGDDCCPGMCNPSNDDDCSNACGDGKIDKELGETCEPSMHPCEKDDKECADKDPCTLDRLVGSPKNCNSLCTHTQITERVDGDQCCPSGADNSLDSDCAPMCGNGVRERGEDCDGGEGCSSDCKSEALEAERECGSSFGTNACKQCLCTQCTEQALACWGSDDVTSNQLCTAISDCSERSGCFDTECFCAPGNPPCIATGPCSTEIANAAGSREPLIVSTIGADPNSTLGRSKTLAACRIDKCKDVCAPKAE